MGQATDEKTKAEITAIEHRIMSAIQQRDEARLRELLSEDFVHRTASGGEADKSAFVASIKAIPGSIAEIAGENLNVDLFGEIAVMTGIQRARVVLEDGTEIKGANSFTDIFRKRADTWLLALAYSTDL